MSQSQPDQTPPAELRRLADMLRGGQARAAADAGEGLLAAHPDDATLHNLVGSAHMALGEAGAAHQRFARAIALDPGFAPAHFNLGNALRRLGRPEEAIAAYRAAIAIDPSLDKAHNNLGNALRETGKLLEAAQAFYQAIELRPGFAAAHANYANALRDLNRPADAEASYRAALKIEPRSAEVHANLGIVLRQLRRFDEAAACFRTALAIRPERADFHLNLGMALRDLGRLDEAVAAFRRAIALRSDYPAAQMAALHHGMQMCDWSVLAEFAGAIPRLGVEGEAVSPFAMLSLEDSPERHRRRAEGWTQRYFRWRERKVYPRPAAMPQRIKLGYFSASFHDHAALQLLSGMFREHDRARFEVHAFSYGLNREGALRQQLIANVEHFHDVGDVVDRKLVAHVQALGLDIAVDLMGYTQHSRSGLFAFGLAPLQVNYMGYPGTMGAPFLDYILADRHVIPPGQRAHYSEAVIAMPHCYLANDDQRPIAARPASRAECGLPEKGFVFACFNNTHKIMPAEFAIWMRLLGKVDGSVLWLLGANRWAEANLRRQAAACGVDPARLVFAPRMAQAEHLARHRLADLFLDTFVYNAHTTAGDALWAGLPLLTLPGEGFAARVAASTLHAACLPELIANSPEDYEALALALASDPARLADLRARLADGLPTKPLFDSQRWTRDLEAAWTEIVRRHVSGEPPSDLVVADMAR